MKVKVEKVIYNTGRNPIAVHIQNRHISDRDISNYKVDVYTNSSNKTVVAAHTNKILYVGETNAEDSIFNNFLVIRNKNTNKVRLVNYDSAYLDSFTKLGDSDLNKAATSEGTRAELSKQFGSKKAKRVTEQREKMKFDIENAKGTLMKAISERNTDECILNISQTEESEISYLPKINRNASSVEKVYELVDLMPSQVMDNLQSDVDTLLQCEDFSELPLCNFCCHYLRIMKGNDEIESDSTRCKIYLYLNYLLEFLTTPVKSMNKKFVVCKSSTELNFFILDEFSVSTKHTRTRSTFMRDKLICLILVLAMKASSNNKVNLEILSQDMKLGIKKLKEISRVLSFSSTATSNEICLKLPLPPPVSFSTKKKNKK